MRAIRYMKLIGETSTPKEEFNFGVYDNICHYYISADPDPSIVSKIFEHREALAEQHFLPVRRRIDRPQRAIEIRCHRSRQHYNKNLLDGI